MGVKVQSVLTRTIFPGLPLFLGLAWGYAVFRQGGVEPEDWALTLLALGLLAVLAMYVTPSAGQAPPLDRWFLWPLVLLPVFVVLQLVPMPLPVLGLLSPARAEHADALASVSLGRHFLPLSVLPSATWVGLFQILACTAVFLLVRQSAWQRPERLWALAWPIVIVAGLEATLGLVQVAMGGRETAANGTYVNRNHFAGLLEMSLPFAVMGAMARLKRKSRHDSLPLGAAIDASSLLLAAGMMLLAVLLSLSRMGFVAALVSLAMPALLFWGGRLPARSRWMAVGIVAGLFLLSFVFLPPDQLVVRFALLADYDPLKAVDRLLYWRDTLPLIAAYPLAGCGLGAYEPAFQSFNRGAPMFLVDFAHNDYLQVLAELGAVGFALMAALMLAVLARVFRAATEPLEWQYRCLGLASAGAVCAILLHSLVDFNLYIPANALLLAWVSGMTAGLEFAPLRKPLWQQLGLQQVIEIGGTKD